MQTVFSLREVARIFGLKESRLRYWAQTGFINPKARSQGRRAYSFADLIEVKAAKELLDRGIPLQRVRRNLRALREAIPGKANLVGRLRVCSDGDTLVVVDGATAVEPISGQAVLDFEIAALGDEIAEVLQLPASEIGSPSTDEPRAYGRPPVPNAHASTPVDTGQSDGSAYAWFVRGLSFESDPDRGDDAIRAYMLALERDPGLAAAHTNLGNIYYRRDERSKALRCYEAACALDPDQPEARYNLANVYEEEGDLEMAIAEYRRALQLCPRMADAHFNLAMTLEQVGSRRQATHHWATYLGLVANDESSRPWCEIARRHLERLS